MINLSTKQQEEAAKITAALSYIVEHSPMQIKSRYPELYEALLDIEVTIS